MPERLLESYGIDFPEPGQLFLQMSQPFGKLAVADRNVFLLISIVPVLQGFVIDIAAGTDGLHSKFELILCQIRSVSECPVAHGGPPLCAVIVAQEGVFRKHMFDFFCFAHVSENRQNRPQTMTIMALRLTAKLSAKP